MNRVWLLILPGLLLLPMAGALAEGPPALAPIQADQWDAVKAAHLLSRAGFGGTPAEILKLSMMTPEQAVAFMVDYDKRAATAKLEFPAFDSNDPAVVRQIERQAERRYKDMVRAAKNRMKLNLEEAMKVDPNKKYESAPAEREGNNRRRRNRYGRQANESPTDYMWRIATRQGMGAARRRHQYQNLARLRAWWLTQMASTDRPLEEKMALFWHGHFATGFQTVRNATHMQMQNETFRRNATGNFGELVRKVARDPAMLRYLDGNRNIKSSPNENWARELMELFTIGRGNYTEKDIKESARSFTGWAYRGNRFFFNRRQHDNGQKTFMGKTGNFNGDDIIKMILAQPETSKFIVTKLCKFFMTDAPDAKLVDSLASTFVEGNYEVKPVLRQLFLSEAFYADGVIKGQIKSPAQLIVGTVRMLGLPAEAAGLGYRHMAQMGQDLFQPPNVKGWDGGRAWINSSTTLVRYNFARDWIAGAASLVRRIDTYKKAQENGDGDMGNMMERRRGGDRNRKRNNKRPSGPQYQLAIVERAKGFTEVDDLVDHLVALFIQGDLSEKRRAELKATLAPDGMKFDPKSNKTIQRLRSALILITSLPEYQLG